DAGGLSDVLEIRAAAAAAEVAEHADVFGAGRDKKQIELAGEIKVHQRAVNRRRIVKPGILSDIGGGAIGGELEQFDSLVAQHNPVFVAVVVHVADQAARVFRAGLPDNRLAWWQERSVVVEQQAKIAVALADKQVIRAAMIDIEHADRAVKVFAGGAQGLPYGVGEGDFHTAAFRLIELKRQPHLGVNAPLEGRGIGRRIRFSGDEFLMPVQRLLRLLPSAQPKQRLAEKKIRERIIRRELNDLGELIGGLLIMLQLQVRAPELETGGIHFGIDVLGLLQK